MPSKAAPSDALTTGPLGYGGDEAAKPTEAALERVRPSLPLPPSSNPSQPLYHLPPLILFPTSKVAAELRGRAEAHAKFSRHRTELEGADVDYINDRNKVFNKKVRRAYDKYTVEIRQNLERGTAL